MFLRDINPDNYDFDNKERLDLMSSQQEQFDYFKKYYELHYDFVIPTTIKINVENFLHDIKKYHNLFRQWGENRNHLPRYGLSLVNYDGQINQDIDLTCGPLDLYNDEVRHKYNGYDNKRFLSETDIRCKTEVWDLQSIKPLHLISDYITRSSILLWHKTASFLPHLDTFPRQGNNFRLWGITGTEKDYEFGYVGGKTVKNIEPGRLYLCDTTQWHYAIAHSNWIYTFFISFDANKNSYELIKNNILK